MYFPELCKLQERYCELDWDGNDVALNYLPFLPQAGEKRIYVPLIIFVHDGKIVGTHLSTVDTQESGYDELTDEEYDELNGIYANYIKELVNNYCDEACWKKWVLVL